MIYLKILSEICWCINCAFMFKCSQCRDITQYQYPRTFHRLFPIPCCQTIISICIFPQFSLAQIIIPLNFSSWRVSECEWYFVIIVLSHFLVVIHIVRHVMELLRITACRVMRDTWCRIHIVVSWTTHALLDTSESSVWGIVSRATTPAVLVVDAVNWSVSHVN